MKVAVCSVFEMAGVQERWRPDMIIKALSPSFKTSPSRDGINRLRLTFSDIEDAFEGRRIGPSAIHVSRFADALREHRPGRLLVVCALGISRSPALAILAMMLDGATAHDACEAAAKALPAAKPNRRLLRLGGEHLGTTDDVVSIASASFDYDRATDFSARTRLTELGAASCLPHLVEPRSPCHATPHTP